MNIFALKFSSDKFCQPFKSTFYVGVLFYLSFPLSHATEIQTAISLKNPKCSEFFQNSNGQDVGISSQIQIHTTARKDFRKWKKSELLAEAEKLRSTLLEYEAPDRANIVVEFFAIQTEEMVFRLQRALSWNYRSPQLNDVFLTYMTTSGVLVKDSIILHQYVDQIIQEARDRLSQNQVTYSWFLNFAVLYVKTMDSINLFKTYRNGESISPLNEQIKRNGKSEQHDYIGLDKEIIEYSTRTDSPVLLPLLFGMTATEVSRFSFLGGALLEISEIPKGYDTVEHANFWEYFRHDFGHAWGYGKINAALAKTRQEFLQSIPRNDYEDLLYLIFLWHHEGLFRVSTERNIAFSVYYSKVHGDILKSWSSLDENQIVQRLVQVQGQYYERYKKLVYPEEDK